jgi:hypothetical protein
VQYGGLFINNDAGANSVGNWIQAEDVTVTFTTPNVHAVGAEFYLNNISGVNQNGTISITFNTGASGSAISQAAGPYGFFGIISDDAIQSMTIVHNSGGFLNMANSCVAVPEPTSGVLMLMGLAGLVIDLRRR